ncbi:MAG TPA: twin-arginine translocase subunit TatC [Bacteroidetes bacterium]|nr:twin-arginine translocase subunit TatC [Bacteroidota bacterium]
MALDQVDVDKLEQQNGQETEMSFFDHLEELRWHILRSAVAVFIFAIAAFLMPDLVFQDIILAPTKKDFVSYGIMCDLSHFLHMGKTLCISPKPFDFVNKEFGELFFMHIKISFMVGVVCAFPYLFWEIWKFVKPGLYEEEKKRTRFAVAICSALFFIGVLFGYFIISPFAITFLANYNLPGAGSFQPAFGSYISYIVMLTLPVGIVFEMPVLVYVLAKLGLVTSALMRTYRKHAIVIIVVLASVITPPDVASQILISLPLLLLYQVSIGIAKRVEKKEMALTKT